VRLRQISATRTLLRKYLPLKMLDPEPDYRKESSLMSDGFTIGAAMGEPTIFECPSCKETIDAKAETCRFCGAKVDRDAALRAAALLARVNQACSDASYMKSTAFALPVFFFLRFIPFLSGLGSIGFWALLIVIPGWALLWWLKYRKIETCDADFRRAQKSVLITGIVLSCLLLIFVLLFIFSVLFIAALRIR
jgi:hypothetical protein